MIGPFNDPTITDITQIPVTMESLKSFSMVIAYALIGFLVPLEIISNNLKSIEGRGEITGIFIRVGLVFVGLILYDRIFGFIVEAAQIVELSILSERQWSDLLAKLAEFFQTRKITILSSMPLVFTWVASFMSLVIKNILYWIRFCLLSVLYFAGPIAFTFLILEHTTYLPKAWFKNVIQLSLWPIVMKIMVRVLLELQIMTYLTTANTQVDIMTLIGINTTFVVLLVFSPYFTARFISGETFGPVAVMASSFITTKGLMLMKTMGLTTAGLASRTARAANFARSSSRILTASKTALRDTLFKPQKRGSRP